MSQRLTTMEDNFCSQMMDTSTFLLGMVGWLEIHLGNMGTLRISRTEQSAAHPHT